MSRPHGGELVNRDQTHKRKRITTKEVSKMPRKMLDSESLSDIVNIAQGVYSPLQGFMCREELSTTLDGNRLPNDVAWTIPIVLTASEDEAKRFDVESEILLVDEQNLPIAIMHLEEVYGFDKEKMARGVFGTLDRGHPGVAKVLGMNPLFLGGKVDLVRLPNWDYSKYHLTPMETRILFREKGWKTIVGFQTRNVPHVGHEYLQKTALTFVDGIFINPVIGKKKVGDFLDEVIIKAFQALIEEYYPKDRVVLSTFETEMRYAGPKEAIFHAIARKNYGCDHIIIGRDHAGVGNYYGPYDAHEIFNHFPDLGIEPIKFRSFSKCGKCNAVVNDKICPHPPEMHSFFAGREIRSALKMGKPPDPEVMRPEVAKVILDYENPFVTQN